MNEETKNVIEIPKVELVSVDELKVDGQNPNRMTAQQTEALTESQIQSMSGQMASI